MKSYVARFTKGMDLKVALESFCKEHKIKAGVIVCCVGCLDQARLRNAGGKDVITLLQPLEIVSITGTVSVNGCHIHISVSDEELKTYGGHLKKGCLINTTAEVVVLGFDDYKFERKMDVKTGYKELVIHENI